LFSVIIGDQYLQFYFNFQAYPNLDADLILSPSHLDKLKPLFSNPLTTWYAHKATFDLAFLAREGIFISGTIHCTRSIALIEYNEHQSYTLDACGERIGYSKDATVEDHIQKNKLYEKRAGATQSYTHKFFDRVPFPLISRYGARDAEVCYRLGHHQEKALQGLADATPPALPSVLNILRNERRLTRTVFRMEHLGVRIDRPYCVQAARFEAARAAGALAEFKTHTGVDFKNSPKLFQEVFREDREFWGVTDKGNPSFASEALQQFRNPGAKAVLTYRDAVSKENFYNGFIYHADRDDIVHPKFHQDGAGHGRFSSSDPNFQNLSNEEGIELEQEFVVRRAIIPRPGFILLMPDFNTMEYSFLFDLACKQAGRESEIVRMMKEQGLDPHQATANAVTAMGTPLTRKRAKNGNFAFLFGSGNETLAATIGSSVSDAAALKSALRKASPEVAALIKLVTRTAEVRGWIFNWAGRRCHFPDPRFAYRAINYLVSGGCADINKMALNAVDEYLLCKKSKMIMTIHDEIPIECHESEVAEVPRRVVELMESIYPHEYLPITASMEWSDKSLADKTKGYPV